MLEIATLKTCGAASLLSKHLPSLMIFYLPLDREGEEIQVKVSRGVSLDGEMRCNENSSDSFLHVYAPLE